MSFFYYNGYYSNEMGLIVEEKNIYNGPQPDFELISVPGRDGDVVLDHNRYKNVEVSYTVSFIGTKEKAAALRQWLCARADYGYLFDSEQPDHFRYAAFVSQLNIEEVIRNVGRAKLTFSCKPYIYRKDGAYSEKHTASGFTLTNPEDYPSVPDITIYGSGTITLNINYRSYTIKDVSNHVTLDGELMNAYAGSALLNDKIQFTEWPTLRRGTSTIEWIGNVRSVYITPNWRTL
ncbi:MAG: phage tail family protein [Clostridia bacterium]|nr:phage tail family protein [Clostridia bacterium]